MRPVFHRSARRELIVAHSFFCQPHVLGVLKYSLREGVNFTAHSNLFVVLLKCFDLNLSVLHSGYYCPQNATVPIYCEAGMYIMLNAYRIYGCSC